MNENELDEINTDSHKKQPSVTEPTNPEEVLKFIEEHEKKTNNMIDEGHDLIKKIKEMNFKKNIIIYFNYSYDNSSYCNNIFNIYLIIKKNIFFKLKTKKRTKKKLLKILNKTFFKIIKKYYWLYNK